MVQQEGVRYMCLSPEIKHNQCATTSEQLNKCAPTATRMLPSNVIKSNYQSNNFHLYWINLNKEKKRVSSKKRKVLRTFCSMRKTEKLDSIECLTLIIHRNDCGHQLIKLLLVHFKELKVRL